MIRTSEMAPHLRGLAGIVALMAFIGVGCTVAQPTPTPILTPTSTPIVVISDSAPEYWKYVNRLLQELYRLPPVVNPEELNSAAFLVSANWAKVAQRAVEKLKNQDIAFARTQPICYLLYWYIQADRKMLDVSTPLDFMAAEERLVERVRWVDEEANHLVESKLVGEYISTYATEAACIEGFVTR